MTKRPKAIKTSAKRVPHKKKDKTLKSIKKTGKRPRFSSGNYEEIFRKFIMASRDAVSIIGLDGTMIFCSERTASLHGYTSADKLAGVNVFDLIAPESEGIAREQLQKIIKEGFAGGLEYIFLRKDGARFTASLSGAVINNSEAKPFAVMTTFADITAAKKIKEKLLESQERYRLLFENANDIIFLREVIDGVRPGRMIEINSVCEKILGFTREELLGMTPPEIISREKIFNINKAKEDLFEKGSAVFEEIMMTKGGVPLYFEVNAHIVDYLNKKTILAIARDITSRKIDEEKLRESEVRYRKLVEMSPDAVVAADTEGVVMFVSDASYDVLGINGNLKGRNMAELVSPEEKPRMKKIIKKIFMEYEIRNEEFVFITDDGDRFIGDFNASLVLDSAEKPMYILGVIRDITEAKKNEMQMQENYSMVKKIMDGIIHSMELLVERKDVYTMGHQHRTAQLAKAIASEMGMAREQVECIGIAAIIHDIGKIFVSGDILNKKGGLTDEEYDIIKEHPGAGHEILKSIEFPWPVAEIIRQHHERLDGSGYPDGLKDKDIYIESRIISVADVVEAITFERPYRPALGVENALEEIEKNRGRLYDPEIVGACVKIFRDKGFKFETNPDVF